MKNKPKVWIGENVPKSKKTIGLIIKMTAGKGFMVDVGINETQMTQKYLNPFKNNINQAINEIGISQSDFALDRKPFLRLVKQKFSSYQEKQIKNAKKDFLSSPVTIDFGLGRKFTVVNDEVRDSKNQLVQDDFMISKDFSAKEIKQKANEILQMKADAFSNLMLVQFEKMKLTDKISQMAKTEKQIEKPKEVISSAYVSQLSPLNLDLSNIENQLFEMVDNKNNLLNQVQSINNNASAISKFFSTEIKRLGLKSNDMQRKDAILDAIQIRLPMILKNESEKGRKSRVSFRIEPYNNLKKILFEHAQKVETISTINSNLKQIDSNISKIKEVFELHSKGIIDNEELSKVVKLPSNLQSDEIKQKITNVLEKIK